MDTQQKKILEYLKTGKGLTNADAVRKFHAYRLSGQIKELRDKGHNIVTIMHYELNSENEPVRYGEYRLIKER